MELLIITPDIGRWMWHLHDAKGNSLGWFRFPEDAEAWCKANGYRCRVER